jgi:two-component system, LytTR family, response regulator
MKTVIVDDNTQAAQDLATRLQAYKNIELVGTAQNGLDGLSVVNETQPDLLFLDVRLPDISGLDFLERINSFTHGKCRVVMFTAYDEYVLSAFRKQAFDVLLKPIDDNDLNGIIQRLATFDGQTTPISEDEEAKNDTKPSDKFLLYINSVDFKLVNRRDVGLFLYNHELRCWEAVVAGHHNTVKMKRNIKSDDLLALDSIFVQVNQKCIININYLIEVVDNICRFYPPFDNMASISVGRLYRRKLTEKFFCL